MEPYQQLALKTGKNGLRLERNEKPSTCLLAQTQPTKIDYYFIGLPGLCHHLHRGVQVLVCIPKGTHDQALQVKSPLHRPNQILWCANKLPVNLSGCSPVWEGSCLALLSTALIWSPVPSCWAWDTKLRSLGHKGEIIGLDIQFSKPGNVSSQEVMSLSTWG